MNIQWSAMSSFDKQMFIVKEVLRWKEDQDFVIDKEAIYILPDRNNMISQDTIYRKLSFGWLDDRISQYGKFFFNPISITLDAFVVISILNDFNAFPFQYQPAETLCMETLKVLGYRLD